MLASLNTSESKLLGKHASAWVGTE